MTSWFSGKSFQPEKDIPDLSGKVILVTGGNAGLGKESILQLAKHEPKQMFLAARSQAKAESAVTEIKKTVPNAAITILPLDLSSFDSVKKAVDMFKSRSDRLDLLINNAGIMATPYSTTTEGYEIQFGTNHIGHTLFTKLLMPTLLETAKQPGADVRVIQLSSDGHNLAPSGGIIFDQSALEEKLTWTRYGQSKLANILFARELAKRYPSITAVSLHPGVIMTDLYGPSQQSNVLLRLGLWAVGGIFMSDVPEGAKNQLWAATAPKEDVRKGYYYRPIARLSKGSAYAQDEKLAEKLWEWTEEEFKKHGF
ncbi:oxidoreductase [Cryomyces antarcticus]|uniref:Oxidoreductase n=1 Tax=Cryomyces antarcticus TaxID=329879 RepID=A0ABR0LNM1_9PEZI|nr:hypothetical protein LTR60_004051 [Cryomyces antarcticus]KAK5016035.1 hypothetical protein LTR39_002294 [Cryomyces antarcticus]KAK5170000.1 hypothetical protein LTR04_005231 [Oleoguttula sp. CCFEE 6159]KAK5201155.1 hypothetical protein LTR16_003637 [Cryomyces antarcticus]